MKRMANFIVVLVVIFCLSACAPALQIGVGLAGKMLGETKGLTTDTTNAEIYSKPKLSILVGTLIDRYDVGQSVVEINKGMFFNQPVIIFTALNNNGVVIGRFFLGQKNENHMKEFRQFSLMDDEQKKQFLRENFLTRAKINIDTVVPATALPESEPKTTVPVPALKFPPGFAPTPR